jgi:hypothetical protein
MNKLPSTVAALLAHCWQPRFWDDQRMYPLEERRCRRAKDKIDPSIRLYLAARCTGGGEGSRRVNKQEDQRRQQVGQTGLRVDFSGAVLELQARTGRKAATRWSSRQLQHRRGSRADHVRRRVIPASRSGAGRQAFRWIPGPTRRRRGHPLASLTLYCLPLQCLPLHWLDSYSIYQCFLALFRHRQANPLE